LLISFKLISTPKLIDLIIKSISFVSIYDLQATSIFFIRRIEKKIRNMMIQNEMMTVGIKELSKICPMSAALKSR